MADRNVQVVRIIVGNRLPVEVPGADGDAAEHAQILEPVGRDFLLIRRHDFGDRWNAGLKRHEQEAAPVFERDRKQAMVFGPEAGIFLAMRNSD